MFGEPGSHLFPCHMRILIQHGLGRHDEARGAVTALYAAIFDPRALQGMEVCRGPNPLDRLDHSVIPDFCHLLHAGADRFPVQDDRTRPALARTAADFEARQAIAPEYVAEGVFIGVRVQGPFHAVDNIRTFLDSQTRLLSGE